MGVLSPEGGRYDKLVGAYMPPRVISYLVLYGVANGLSKSKVLRNVVEEWIKEQQTQSPIKNLITDIAKIIKTKWKKERLSGGRNVSFTNFMQDVERELLEKGISEVYVKLIIAEVTP